MGTEQQREWYAKEITKVQKYLDWLKTQSRKLAYQKSVLRKVDPDRPDLMQMKDEQ